MWSYVNIKTPVFMLSGRNCFKSKMEQRDHLSVWSKDVLQAYWAYLQIFLLDVRQVIDRRCTKMENGTHIE